jgi:hypothetical protein
MTMIIFLLTKLTIYQNNKKYYRGQFDPYNVEQNK